MQELNLILLDRLGQLEAKQHLMTEAIIELQRKVGSTDEPVPAKTAPADSLANWSRRGLNLRLPQIDPLP